MARRLCWAIALATTVIGCAPQLGSPSPSECPILAAHPTASQDTTVYDPSSTSPAPRRLRSEPAHYPDVLFAAGRDADATAEFVVAPSGRPEPASIRVISTSSPLLVPTITEIAKHTVYCPGVRDGELVRTRSGIRVRFSIGPDPFTGRVGVGQQILP